MKSWILGLGAGLLVLLLGTRKVSATKKYPDTYDYVFRAECPGIPVEYLRALARHESDMNPSEATGGAWGLLQVWWQGSVLDDYNEREGTSYTRDDLLDPSINARIACTTLHRIANYYGRAFPRVFPRPSWRDRRFVEIVTLGWNAGWGEKSGVAYVIAVLEDEGHTTDVDLDMIADAVFTLPQVTDKLRRTAPYGWVRKVVAGYLAQIGNT